MSDMQWYFFFKVCAEILGGGDSNINLSKSWCSWTTFSRLRYDSGYWQAGIPQLENIGSAGINDSGPWGQPFLYSDIAHIIIPSQFCTDAGFMINQDILLLSETLKSSDVIHELSNIAIQINIINKWVS